MGVALRPLRRLAGRTDARARPSSAALLHPSARPEGALERVRRGSQGGNGTFLPEVGVVRLSPTALVGRSAVRGWSLREAVGAVAAAHAPPPRGAQCQAGGDSGWRLRRDLQRGLWWRRRLRHLGPGEQRAPGGAA